jgi:hypothetical protein
MSCPAAYLYEYGCSPDSYKGAGAGSSAAAANSNEKCMRKSFMVPAVSSGFYEVEDAL